MREVRDLSFRPGPLPMRVETIVTPTTGGGRGTERISSTVSMIAPRAEAFMSVVLPFGCFG